MQALGMKGGSQLKARQQRQVPLFADLLPHERDKSGVSSWPSICLQYLLK